MNKKSLKISVVVRLFLLKGILYRSMCEILSWCFLGVSVWVYGTLLISKQYITRG